MEPLTAGVIVTLAFKTAFGETIKNLTQATLAKIDELRKKILQKFRGNLQAETALKEAEKGSEASLDKVAEYLQAVMVRQPEFASDIEKLAHEIQQEINIGKIQGKNLQNVYGGKAYQNNADNNSGTIYQGENTIHHH